ncbi:MAG: hypothetical protein HC912_08550 [Saprospiraceae bacterium]|nr:hypothetical protein [Saprospiraceae bacterium]
MDNLVENIISGKINAGQLNESKLSFGELAVCQNVFKHTLRSIHHPRITYPK